MKIDYWYKALQLLALRCLSLMERLFLTDTRCSIGFFVLRHLFYWFGGVINHPLKVRFIGPGVWTRGYNVLRAHSVSSSTYLVVS